MRVKSRLPSNAAALLQKFCRCIGLQPEDIDEDADWSNVGSREVTCGWNQDTAFDNEEMARLSNGTTEVVRWAPNDCHDEVCAGCLWEIASHVTEGISLDPALQGDRSKDDKWDEVKRKERESRKEKTE